MRFVFLHKPIKFFFIFQCWLVVLRTLFVRHVSALSWVKILQDFLSGNLENNHASPAVTTASENNYWRSISIILWTVFKPNYGHNWFRPPSLLVEGLLSTGPTTSSFYLVVEGLPLHLFPAYRWWELVQLFIKRHHQKCLKLTKVCLGPI